jgi:hypothetical protein
MSRQPPHNNRLHATYLSQYVLASSLQEVVREPGRSLSCDSLRARILRAGVCGRMQEAEGQLPVSTSRDTTARDAVDGSRTALYLVTAGVSPTLQVPDRKSAFAKNCFSSVPDSKQVGSTWR